MDSERSSLDIAIPPGLFEVVREYVSESMCGECYRDDTSVGYLPDIFALFIIYMREAYIDKTLTYFRENNRSTLLTNSSSLSPSTLNDTSTRLPFAFFGQFPGGAERDWVSTTVEGRDDTL